MKPRLNRKNIPILATIAVFLLIYLIGSVMYDSFFSLRVFVNLFIDNAFVGVIAIGMTFVTFQGTLSSWWTKIVIGVLLFVFILLQRYLSAAGAGKSSSSTK